RCRWAGCSTASLLSRRREAAPAWGWPSPGCSWSRWAAVSPPSCAAGGCVYARCLRGEGELRVWLAELAVLLLVGLAVALPVPPHFFGLAQRTGGGPQRKPLFGWWRPREVSGPARLSHSRGSCHSAAKVSASRTDWITRPRGEGFGLAEV